MGITAASIPGFCDPFIAPEHLASESKSVMPAGKKATPKTDVARMVAGGIIQPGTRIVLSHRKTEYWAEICSDGRVKLVDTGTVYTKVDEAGCFVRETRTCDGMKLWCIIGDDGSRRSLREVRDAARAAGTLTINRR
jgi:hypothetical protein